MPLTDVIHDDAWLIAIPSQGWLNQMPSELCGTILF